MDVSHGHKFLADSHNKVGYSQARCSCGISPLEAKYLMDLQDPQSFDFSKECRQVLQQYFTDMIFSWTNNSLINLSGYDRFKGVVF